MKTLLTLIVMGMALRSYAQSPVELLGKSGIKGGLIVHVGCGDGSETVKLAAAPQYTVQGLTSKDPAAIRKQIIAGGKYGQVSLYQWDGKKLPYADNLVNLVVISGKGQVARSEIMRVLCPLGKAYIKTGSQWKELSKPWPKGMDQWNHYLHGADNNAVAMDENIGAPRSLQWVAGPRWGRSHEEMAGTTIAVTANGRLFSITDEGPHMSVLFNPQRKLIAQDAFNGIRLWEKPIAQWIDHMRHFRTGPTHISRRLVAVGDKVYVTLGLEAPVSCLDGATGKTLKVYKGTERTEEIVFHDGKLFLMVGASEIKRTGSGLQHLGEPKPSEERHILVLNAETGEELWRKNARDGDYVHPLSLTAKGKKVYYHSIKGLHCVDAKDGKQLWFVERPSVATRYSYSTSTLVVTDDVALLADRKTDSKGNKRFGIAKDNIKYDVNAFPQRGLENEMTAYSSKDGEKLWSVPCAEGYSSPVDIFVIDKTVWLGSEFSKGYELMTGRIVKELNTKGDPTGMGHDRCHRNRATVNFILTCHDGIETIDLEKGWTGNNSWIRGTCQYGIMPANGLIYTPPNACACHPKVKMQGYVAVSSKLPESSQKELPPTEKRLFKGLAFDRLQAISANPKSEAWPMYRHDRERSGASKTTVSGISKEWTAKIGGRLTQPVIGNGKVYVASTDAHTVYALDAGTGQTTWTYTAGGRIDSSPSLYKGLLIFGSADGCVYCLDASNGELAWRFQAAPEERLVSVLGQPESTWPVHGSVLVQSDAIFFTAGRNSYLDGGIYFYRMDPVAGKVLASKPIRDLDPKTGKQTGKEWGGSFDSEGTLNDILSGDGKSVFLKHLRFDEAGKKLNPNVPHLWCQTGFLGEESFVRSYWFYGTHVWAGYFGWASMKGPKFPIAPSGKLISFDDKHAYGYGRVQLKGAFTGHRGNIYHFYSSDKVYSSEIKTYRWTKAATFIARAMVLTKDKLFVAGIPELGKTDKKGLRFNNNDEALKTFMGEKGAYLRTISLEHGIIEAGVELETAPVFDGMSAAKGRLFISLKNGTVVCYE